MLNNTIQIPGLGQHSLELTGEHGEQLAAARNRQMTEKAQISSEPEYRNPLGDDFLAFLIDVEYKIVATKLVASAALRGCLRLTNAEHSAV